MAGILPRLTGGTGLAAVLAVGWAGQAGAGTYGFSSGARVLFGLLSAAVVAGLVLYGTRRVFEIDDAIRDTSLSAYVLASAAVTVAWVAPAGGTTVLTILLGVGEPYAFSIVALVTFAATTAVYFGCGRRFAPPADDPEPAASSADDEDVVVGAEQYARK